MADMPGDRDPRRRHRRRGLWRLAHGRQWRQSQRQGGQAFPMPRLVIIVPLGLFATFAAARQAVEGELAHAPLLKSQPGGHVRLASGRDISRLAKERLLSGACANHLGADRARRRGVGVRDVRTGKRQSCWVSPRSLACAGCCRRRGVGFPGVWWRWGGDPGGPDLPAVRPAGDAGRAGGAAGPWTAWRPAPRLG